MFRSLYVLVPVCALTLAALVGCAGDGPAKGEGVTVKEIQAADLEAGIKENKGKVILIDCWATWCAPCVKKFPQLVERHKKYGDKGLTCMSLSLDKAGPKDEYKSEKVLTFLKEKGASFPNFIVADPRKDSEGFIKLLGDFEGLPYVALFDRTGRRVWTSDDRPKLKEEEFNKKIEELLSEKH